MRCGWPKKHWPGRREICPCGFLFPDKIQKTLPQWHESPYAEFDEPEPEEMDFG
jgi:hypothetical protein